MSVKPVTPKEARELKTFPDKVIETWNAAIVEGLVEGRVTIKQDHIVNLLASAMDVERDVVFNKGWLNVEDFYRSAGWKVEYDKPGYNENYTAFFVFSAKRNLE
jgi:hypothetical protein